MNRTTNACVKVQPVSLDKRAKEQYGHEHAHTLKEVLMKVMGIDLADFSEGILHTHSHTYHYLSAFEILTVVCIELSKIYKKKESSHFVFDATMDRSASLI